MRTKEEIEYDLKRMDEEEKQRKLMLKIIESYHKMIDDLSSAREKMLGSIERIENIGGTIKPSEIKLKPSPKIDLPPPPPIIDPPISSPEEIERYKKLMNEALESLNKPLPPLDLTPVHELRKTIDKALKQIRKKK